jgi:hypothetical protein
MNSLMHIQNHPELSAVTVPMAKTPTVMERMEGMDQILWTMMQITDSSLPTGSLSHSQGLESAVYYDFIRAECDSKSLHRFLYLCLEQVNLADCIFSAFVD